MAIKADWVYTPDGWVSDAVITLDEDGRISEVQSEVDTNQELESEGGASDDSFDCLLPGFINAHSHAFQYGLRGGCQEASSFDDWVDTSLYPLVENLGDSELERLVRGAFEEMVQSGFTTVGEFHYIHNGIDGEKRGNELDRRVIEIARDVGLRVGFIRCFYDKSGAPARKRFLESPEEARRHFTELFELYETDSAVQVLPGPHSLHGASLDMIRLGNELSKAYDVPYHVHISEQKPEVDSFQDEHGTGLLTHLRENDAFGSGFVGIHGVWLDDEEIQYLARKGTGLVTCPTTNMLLGDGISPLQKLLADGGRFSLGTDSNQRIDAFEEARLAEWLQRIETLNMNTLGDEEDLSAQLLRSLTESGATSLGMETGRIEEGYHADLVEVPLKESFGDGDAEPSPDLERILFSEGSPDRVKRVIVGGEIVYESPKYL